jgi:hypothetical protein
MEIALESAFDIGLDLHTWATFRRPIPGMEMPGGMSCEFEPARTTRLLQV